MGERAFEANGLDNDDAFPDDNHHGESKEEPPIEIRPLESTRADLVEKMCKWFGSKPLDGEKYTDTTNCPLRNHNASATLTEEGQWGRHNGTASEQISWISSASMQARFWEQIAPSQKQRRYESLNNTQWVSSEPPTLFDEEEGTTPPFKQNSSSKEFYTETDSTTIWFTPPDRFIEERRGRLESYDSSQSLSYFTAASDLSTLGVEIEDTTDYEYEEEESAMGYIEPTHEIEARIMAALNKYTRNESNMGSSDDERWMIDDRSCDSADLSSLHTIDTYDDWDDEYKTDCLSTSKEQYLADNTIDQFPSQDEEEDINGQVRPANEKLNTIDTNDDWDECKVDCLPTSKEHYHAYETIDQFLSLSQDCEDDEYNGAFDEPKLMKTTTADEVESIEGVDELCEEQPSVTIEMGRLIIECNKQWLLPWTMRKQLDETTNRIGYEHQFRLISTRMHMIRRIGTALELAALLRRCSYPKRDVIRWSSVTNGNICLWKIFQLI